MYYRTLKLQPGVLPLLTKLGLDILVESRGIGDVEGRTGGAMWSLELEIGLGSVPVASEAPQLNGQP